MTQESLQRPHLSSLNLATKSQQERGACPTLDLELSPDNDLLSYFPVSGKEKRQPASKGDVGWARHLSGICPFPQNHEHASVDKQVCACECRSHGAGLVNGISPSLSSRWLFKGAFYPEPFQLPGASDW